MKRWGLIFRALANVNRIRIVEMLRGGEKMSVSEITDNLGISFKATSNHLTLLKNLDILESRGAPATFIIP